MRKKMNLVALAIVISGSAVADSPGRQPWEWTDEERVAARLDPVQIAEREKAEAGEAVNTASRASARNYAIDGSRHPELLLPHELFRGLLEGFIPNEELRQRKRDSLRATIVAAGLDEALFWAQLRSVASDYIDNHVYPPTGSEGRPGRCRSAFIALNNARRLFGRERFDRVLYEGIAPVTQISAATNAADPASELLWVSGGCH